MWRIAHALLPASNQHLRIARLDGLSSQHHGLESGATHLVDRHGRGRCGHARLQHGLAPGSLTRTALQHMPHDHLLHRARGNPAALESGADGNGAELRRRQGRKAPEIPPDRRARGTDDHRLASEIVHG